MNGGGHRCYASVCPTWHLKHLKCGLDLGPAVSQGSPDMYAKPGRYDDDEEPSRNHPRHGHPHIIAGLAPSVRVIGPVLWRIVRGIPLRPCVQVSSTHPARGMDTAEVPQRADRNAATQQTAVSATKRLMHRSKFDEVDGASQGI
jgi:hypothetical protein